VKLGRDVRIFAPIVNLFGCEIGDGFVRRPVRQIARHHRGLPLLIEAIRFCATA
jgi:hypothetical protein